VSERAFVPTTLQGLNWLAFYHPDAQRACLDAAERAGAEVRRGARVTALRPGPRPAVTVEQDGRTFEIGRTDRRRRRRPGVGRPRARRLRDAPRSREALLRRRIPRRRRAPGRLLPPFSDPFRSRIAYVFPQRDGRARCYVGWHATAGVPRLQGASSYDRFRTEAEEIGVPRDAFAAARLAGPLATFEGADSWVEHPYRDGVALLGDAAATSDPTWGQGMSMALRGARVLRDALAGTDDWDAAGHAYAADHDRAYAVVHRADGWFEELFMEPGPEADERRARAFPLLAADPTRVVDVPSSGPESPCDDAARHRFFGED